MAVASDDLPRFSLLAGADGVYARALTKESEDGIARCLRGEFTCEAWLQIRAVKGRPCHAGDGHGCWWIHSPSWACGLTAGPRVVVVDGGDWYMSAIGPTSSLQSRRWHHLAVCYRAHGRLCQVLVDGEEIQLEALQDPGRLRLPVEPSAGFRFGWAPFADSPWQLLIHEVRLWSSCLSQSVIRRWLGTSVSTEHPSTTQLCAHWSFSSGSLTPTEYDLSGFSHDLTVENATSANWLRETPPGFHRSATSDVARLVSFQESDTVNSSGRSRFVVELQVVPQLDVACSACQAVTVVVMLNFPCFPRPSLTSPDMGTSFVRSLQDMVRRLPSGFSLAIYDASGFREGSTQPALVCDALDEDAKVRACRALDRVVVNRPVDTSEMVSWIADSVRDLEVTHRRGCDKESLFVCTVIVVSSTTPGENEHELIRAVDKLQGSFTSVAVHVVQVGSVTTLPTSPLEHIKVSCLVMQHVSCEADFEWVLAVIVSQMQELMLTGAELVFETVGDASFVFTEESQPVFHRYVGNGPYTQLAIPIGSCTQSNRFQLAGVATFTAKSIQDLSRIVITLTYFSSDKRRHVSQVSLRPGEEITDHFYIEYASRNKRLQISDGDAQLLEQRRALMRRKMTFMSDFVSHEVAEAENAFKKVNIMKEELWSKRKWLVNRGLRLFDEKELEKMAEEATAARSAFARRTEALQSTFAASSRGSDNRQPSRGKNNVGSNPLRVRLEEEHNNKSDHGGTGSDDEDDQSNEHKLQKVCVKLSVQTKALNEHEAKMEDLFVSVRLAEAKGPVIMNDTRRSWVVRYHDMVSSKKAVIDSTLTKDFLQWTLEFHEERVVARQEVEAEVQSINAGITRFDKELGKRRKRALLCAKEIVGSVVDEFEASERIDAAKRDTVKCRLMKTLSITHDMFAACIYVCFPIEISQQEVPTGCSARGFANLIHGVCNGLRQMCDAASESPVCRRITFGEAFLWWGLEQQEPSSAAEESIAAANREARRSIQGKAWAFLVVSYNSLFSSATAISELKDVIATARDQAKPIFHIRLESPYEDLDEFRSQWTCRFQSGKAGVTAQPSVEREFLTWRQNFSSFQALINSVEVVETVAIPRLLRICRCDHGVAALRSDLSWRYPCLECLWPVLGSSQEAVAQSGESPDASPDDSDRWFLHLVCQIGAWVDTAHSVSLQNAPRSYHIDPNAVSALYREWESNQQDLVRQRTTNWSEACTRRTKEIQRQVGKLFKVYEEEARDMVALQFKLSKRREDVLRSMNDQLNNLTDERKLLETWLEKLCLDENETDDGRRGKEIEWMVHEELWQRMHDADAAALHLETLEDQVDTPSDDKLAEAKLVLEVSLRSSSRAVLDLGRGHIEYRFRSLMWGFKRDEYINQIKIANAKCGEQRVQIARMEQVFDQAEQILREMHEQRDAFVVEDAAAFFNGSCLEVHSPPSVTTQDVDHQQLRKLASDLDFHAAFCASTMSQVLQAQFSSSAAVDYRVRLRDAMCAFVEVYSPSIGNYGTMDISTRAASIGFKDYCQFVPDEPAKSYESLLAMSELIDKEALEDREVQRVWGEWKMRFMDALMVSHTQRWWAQCRVKLELTYGQLNDVKSAADQSFELRGASEREFREAVANREKFGHRLALLQRRIGETRQRQQSLLLLLQLSRKCYETSSAVMNGKLQNVKTDVMFKKWSAISDYHVELIGKLFDLRSQCSAQLDELEADIRNCQDSLSKCDRIIDSRRQAWIKHSIADCMACINAEGQQQLAHRTMELISDLERQRVFKLFRVLDPRNVWLTLPTLTRWHDDYIREYQHQEALRKAGGKQSAVGRSGVDDLLVQLSIARLDLIKQEKLRDALHRKIRVLGRILDEQLELRQIVESEAELYRSLGSQMAERVSFLRDQYEASGQSEYLRLESASEATASSSIDRLSAVVAVRESRDLISDMIKSAQQDYLRVEATTCQIAWRMREHIACSRRGERAIEEVQSELIQVEKYLQVLKTKDNELFELSLRSEKPGSSAASGDTHMMGMDLAAGRFVFDFYSRDQWFRSCLSQTTALGERIKSLREVLASLRNIKKSTSRPSTSEDAGSMASVDGHADDIESDAVGQDEQLAILEQELRSAELALLLNRFESRRAEKTSEALNEVLVERFEGGETNSNTPAPCEDGLRDLDTVLSAPKMLSRMFNVSVYTTQRERMLVLLRELATSFDPRDVAGNLSEVIFGASLDRNDLQLIFLLQSKAHVDEQWRVALVALFFARLFRRAALKKAATIRKSEASGLTREKLQVLRSLRVAAHIVLGMHESQIQSNPALSLTELSVKPMRDLLQCVETAREDSSSMAHLQRLALGILMQQPLHRVLAPLTLDGAKSICQVADEMEQQRAVAEHRPPKPTLLQVLSIDRYSIKIEWKPLSMDHDLIYVAEISEHGLNSNVVDSRAPKRYWTQFPTAEKTSHTFYNLHPGHVYWVRVRSGFTRTRLGAPCLPILASTLPQ